MKTAFLVISTICAAAVSMVVFIIASGVIPFRPLPGAGEKKTLATVTNVTGVIGPDIARIRGQVEMADEVVKGLAHEKEALARRASELDVQTEQIRLERVALAALRKDLTDLKKALSSNLVEVAASESDNLKRISEMCAKMDPAAASQMLLELPNERAATILGLVTERAAAKIMDAAITSGTQGAKRAAEWAEILRRLQIGKVEPKESPT